MECGITSSGLPVTQWEQKKLETCKKVDGQQDCFTLHHEGNFHVLLILSSYLPT